MAGTKHIRTLRSKKLHPEHVKLINEAIRHNARGKEKDLHITYRKENGEESERKVRPLAVKGKSLFVAHCHERNAIRSFRVERIGMVKSAFWDGFEKRAIGPRTLMRGAQAALRRAGHEASDLPNMNYHGMEALSRPGALPHQKEVAKYRAHALGELFPKGKAQPKEEAMRRFNLAANENPSDSLMSHENERRALRESINKKNGK